MEQQNADRGAHKDVLGPGVGAVIEAARVDARPVEGRHRHGRGHRTQYRDRRQDPGRTPQLEHTQDHERPDEVELLLDGQAPGMEDRGRSRHQREVALPGEDLVPVAEIEQCAEGVAPEL